MERLVILGFDALDYGIFREVRPEGWTVLPLHSPVPVTGPAWFSIYSGMRLEKHGVRDVWGIPRELPGFGWSRSYVDWTGDCFWHCLNDAGYKCGLFGLPACQPPLPIKGWHVAGCGAAPDDFIWPANLRLADRADPNEEAKRRQTLYERLDLIHRFGGEHPEFREWPRDFKMLSINRATTQAAVDGVAYLCMALELAARTAVDVVFVCFTFVDRILHEQPWLDETKERAYQVAAHLIDLAGREQPGAMMIVADHGGESDHGSERGMHTDMGVLAYKGEGFRPIAEIADAPTYGEPLCLPNPTDASEDVKRPWLMKVDVGGHGLVPSVIDVAPTICALLGAELPKADGRPLWGILEGKEDMRTGERLYQLGYAPKPEEIAKCKPLEAAPAPEGLLTTFVEAPPNKDVDKPR